MMKTKVLLILSSFLFIIIVVLLTSSSRIHKDTKVTVLHLPIISLESKPPLLGIYVKNPDILHNGFGLLSWYPLAPNGTPLLNVPSDWSGTAFVGYNYNYYPLGGRYGVAEFRPISISEGRYIEQKIYLPDGKYKLYLGIADGSGMFPSELLSMGVGVYDGNCSDVGIKVIISDLDKKKDYIIFDKIVKNGRWYDYSIDLSSHFSGKNIKIKVESYAADEGCGLLNGGWAVLDYLDIQPY
jgi:hypothetical protein